MVEVALYHPDAGFYARGGGAGRTGDFLTSPEVGPLFGAVMARALDEWWVALGRPDPFVVVEAGAGRGALAAGILGAVPPAAWLAGGAAHYVAVERSEVWRHRLAARFAGDGRVTVLADLPAGGELEGVVVANELLDNLAFRLLECAGAGWAEVRVGQDLAEVLVRAPMEESARADRLAPGAASGARIALQDQASAWLRTALGSLRRGRVVAIDYATTTAAMAQRPWAEWVRTYRGHGRGGHPLEHLGEQDVTCEVAADQLAHVRVPVADRSQAEFLAAHGIGELAAEARAAWQARAHIGDLEALKWRSRASEAAALVDPAGLGAFRVLEWDVR